MASLSDMFDGSQTTDATSDAQALNAGDYVLVVQGVMDGALVVLEGNHFDSEFDSIDGQLDMTATGFRAFRMCACNIRASVKRAGENTSLKVAILAAS